jgi:hypothetical protein
MRLVVLVATCSTLACGDSTSLRPGAPLIGTWTDAATSGFPLTLSAIRAGATLSSPCWIAHFKPLLLSDSLTFSEPGVVLEAGGLVPLQTGDSLVLVGRLVGKSVVLGQDTLQPGSANVHVCNA